MARILGLDLGSYSIKGVIVEASMRGAPVKSFFEVRCPPEGDRITKLKTALTELLAKGPLQVDQVVVSVPGLSVATHSINLPFTDTKRIELALGGEVEDELPFDLSEAAYDYQVASSDPTGSHLLVGVVKRDELTALLAMLAELKLDPRIVTHSALTYQNAPAIMGPQSLPENPAATVAIVDLGHERSCVAIGRLGQGIELARTFAGGGLNLTRSLATEFQIGLAEAQTWKEEHGAVGEAAVGEDGERASGAFVRGLQPVLRELRSTFKSFTARTKRNIDQVLICGGSARLEGIDRQLERDLGLPVRRLELQAEMREAIAPEQAPAAVQACCLAMRGAASGAKAPRFNLRRGELAFKSDLDFVSAKAPQLVVFGLVLLAMLIGSSIVRNVLLERREKEIDALMCSITQRTVGSCQKDFNIALSMLRGTQSVASSVPRRSAVNLLAEVVARVPDQYPVTVDQVVIDLERVSARFETDSSKHVEDVVSALKGYKCFKEVKEGKLEKNKDGSKVQFRLEIQVECPEVASSAGEG